ncbi:MAG: hypothetical protein CSB49_08615 [Proteobacteria bacterium]|nr:MAG: hypothetical protein CSB49_08615 [Pseudomonadota bacterium]
MSYTQRFDARVGAGLLVALSALYLVLGISSGHSATSHMPPDLSAKKASVDVYTALALMAKQGEKLAIVDVRPAAQRSRYSVPHSVAADAAPAAVLEKTVGKPLALIIGGKDAATAKLVGKIKQSKPQTRVHFLRGGARAWYLALELPVPLFSSKEPPFGYDQAMSTIKAFLAGKADGERAAVVAAIGKLKSLGFAPDLLAGKKPKAGGKKKKISGGCG